MVNFAGFIAGALIARQNGAADEDVARFGIVGALFPNPLLGAVVVQGLTDSGDEGDDQTATAVINVTVPDSTPPTARVYLAGTLSVLDSQLTDWEPDGVEMTHVDGARWTTKLTGPGGAKLEYKFTLGEFAFVEKDADCNEVPNRTLVMPAGGATATQSDTVANWLGIGPCDPAAVRAMAAAAPATPGP